MEDIIQTPKNEQVILHYSYMLDNVAQDGTSTTTQNDKYETNITVNTVTVKATIDTTTATANSTTTATAKESTSDRQVLQVESNACKEASEKHHRDEQHTMVDTCNTTNNTVTNNNTITTIDIDNTTTIDITTNNSVDTTGMNDETRNHKNNKNNTTRRQNVQYKKNGNNQAYTSNKNYIKKNGQNKTLALPSPPNTTAQYNPKNNNKYKNMNQESPNTTYYQNKSDTETYSPRQKIKYNWKFLRRFDGYASVSLSEPLTLNTPIVYAPVGMYRDRSVPKIKFLIQSRAPLLSFESLKQFYHYKKKHTQQQQECAPEMEIVSIEKMTQEYNKSRNDFKNRLQELDFQFHNVATQDMTDNNISLANGNSLHTIRVDYYEVPQVDGKQQQQDDSKRKRVCCMYMVAKIDNASRFKNIDTNQYICSQELEGRTCLLRGQIVATESIFMSHGLYTPYTVSNMLVKFLD
jgi:hypothetical protein